MQEVDLYGAWPWWLRPTAVQMWSAVVIAMATVATVFVYRWIGKLTRKSIDLSTKAADAANQSAQAAIRSAEVAEHAFEAAHRPYFGVCQIEAVSFQQPMQASIRVVMKNYGNVPLSFSTFDIKAIVTIPVEVQALSGAYSEPFGAVDESVVLPGEEAIFPCGLKVIQLYELILSGDAVLLVVVDFNYKSVSTEKEYEFHSRHKYNHAQKSFDVEMSRMN